MLERFLTAQNGYYETALAEIKAGQKETHWMWFIFPQIKGLGYSEISQYYAIQSRSEAKEYLAHPVLGKRLEEISEALLDLKTNDPVAVFGEVDAQKLQSSMTLFWAIGEKSVFGDVLMKYFGGWIDWGTVEILRTMEG
jgi:uncharacterized protein (DUF1810 family)